MKDITKHSDMTMTSGDLFFIHRLLFCRFVTSPFIGCVFLAAVDVAFVAAAVALLMLFIC